MLLIFRFKELHIIVIIVVVHALFVELFVHALVSFLGFLDLEFLFGERGQEKIVLIIDHLLSSGSLLEDFFSASFDEGRAFIGALQSLYFLCHVLFLWLVDVLGGSPLELEDVEAREEDSVDYHRRNVNGEPLEIAKVSTISVLVIDVH